MLLITLKIEKNAKNNDAKSKENNQEKEKN